MKVQVLFFGATADAAGKHETNIDVGESAQLAPALDSVFKDFPGLRSHKLLFAVNEEYAGLDRMIVDGDEVAIFTAVSGG